MGVMVPGHARRGGRHAAGFRALVVFSASTATAHPLSRRSASCPALDQLPRGTKEATLAACASMMADFEEVKVRRAPSHQQRPRQASLSLASVRETETANDPEGFARHRKPSFQDETATVTAKPRKPHIIVLGDKQVGKSTVIDALVKLAADNDVDLRVHEGLPNGCDEMDAFFTQVAPTRRLEPALASRSHRDLIAISSLARRPLRRALPLSFGTPRWPGRASPCATTWRATSSS